MHIALVSLGYVGSCGRMAAFVSLAFARGDAFQLDWGQDRAALSGERVKLQVLHTKLLRSRPLIVWAYML